MLAWVQIIDADAFNNGSKIVFTEHLYYAAILWSSHCILYCMSPPIFHLRASLGRGNILTLSVLDCSEDCREVKRRMFLIDMYDKMQLNVIHSEDRMPIC